MAEEGELNIDKFIHVVFSEGTISTLLGIPRSGKTNLAVVFMEYLVERGYHVYTNINFFQYSQVREAIAKHKLAKGVYYRKKPDEIHIIQSISELLIGLLTTEKNVVMLDETGIFASSLNPRAKNVRTLKELAFIIGHLSSAMMLLAQSKGSIIPDLRSTLVEFEMRVRRLGRTYRIFTIATSVRRMNELTGEEETVFEIAEGDEYHGLPMTIYPFDSKFLPAFDMDLDLTEALKRLAKYNSLDVMIHGGVVVKALAAEEKARRDAKNVKSEKKNDKKEPRDVLKKTGPKSNVKDMVRSELETTKKTIREIANKYRTSYGYVAVIHSDMLKEKGEI